MSNNDLDLINRKLSKDFLAAEQVSNQKKREKIEKKLKLTRKLTADGTVFVTPLITEIEQSEINLSFYDKAFSAIPSFKVIIRILSYHSFA